MKRILSVFLCLAVVLSFGLAVTGCSTMKDYTSGDFIYRRFDNRTDSFVRIKGLSEQGRTKKVIVIPETLDGLRVAFVDRASMFYNSAPMEEFVSDELEKLYIASANIMISDSLEYCTKLTQLFVLDLAGKKDIANYILVHCGSNVIPNVYIFKDYYEELSPNWGIKEHKFAANVTYYYNYSDAPNRGCYWLDNLEAGEKIEILPSEPTRQNDGKDYGFGGWYLEKECINKLDVATYTMPDSGELNLYAKWIEK